MWNSVFSSFQCMNILHSELGGGGDSFFCGKYNEILSVVLLAGLLGGLAWMPPGGLGGLVPCWAWLASLPPACCLGCLLEPWPLAWLAGLPVWLASPGLAVWLA